MTQGAWHLFAPPQLRRSKMTQPNVDDLVQSIASDTGAPRETVSAMVSETWQAFSDGARITDYLPVLVTKRVREDLRSQGRQNRH